MNLTFENQSYPSLSEFIQQEKNKKNFYGKRLEFAHEIDSNIIQALQVKPVKKAVDKLADILVSEGLGMQLSTGIAITPFNYPRLYNILRHCCKTLGIGMPHAVVSSNFNSINAYATGSVENPYLCISDYAHKLMTDDELTFIIGHECGHLAMEHMIYHIIGSNILRIGSLVPIIGPILANTVTLPINAWSRYSEITADRAGFLCCGDLRTSMRALLRLEGGFSDISNVDIDAYVQQSLDSLENLKLGSIKELLFDHPLTSKRIKALELFSYSELYYRVTEKTPPTDVDLLSDDLLKTQVDKLLTVLK